MTFLEMRTLVQGWLDDPSGGYFTDAQVNTWLNNAQSQVANLVTQAFEGYFEKTVETTLVQNQREYQLPDDFKKLVRLEVVLSGSSFQNEDRRRLGKITQNQQDMMYENTGTPNCYYFKGAQVILVPAPDRQKTMRLTYVYRLANLENDNDESEIPIDYHEYICVLAALDGFNKDGRDPGPMLEKRRYYEEQLKRDAEERHIDEPRTIVQTEYDEGFEEVF